MKRRNAKREPTQQARKPISLRRKIVYSLIAQILILGGAEVFVRVVLGPADPGKSAVGTRKFVTWLSDLSTGSDRRVPLFKEDRELMWRLAPNVQIQTFVHYRAKDGELQPIQITINEDGYRGRKPTEVNGRKVARVLCLGDSNFFGYPLDDSQAFPQVLANAVTRELPQRPVEVINGGVPGYSTVQGRLWHARMFAHTERDVLLLSFLNNDAWPQPRTDDASLRWYGSAWYSVSVLIHHSQLVCWLERWIFAASAKSREVPRVPLDEFAQNYESFIREAGKAAVIIVDYRAYRQYEPYSQKLRELAREKGVTYVSVAELIEQEMKEGHALARYPELAKRVQGRWGGLLLQRPYLWYFAEYYPEHLNELGVALLADHMAPLVAAALESRN